MEENMSETQINNENFNNNNEPQVLNMEANNQQQINNIKVDEDYKVPYIKGEKTIVCWNCQSILMVKEEWSVVQCTSCEKINRVPGSQNDINNQIRLNDNMNHFDLFLPYVFVIIVCPFCRTENKARKDAEHVVCFKCHNSYSILKEKSSVSTLNKNNPQYNLPPNKSLRFSDMFFPDPMMFPGQYPNPYFNPMMMNQMQPNFLEGIKKDLKKQLKYEMLKERMFKNEERKVPKYNIVQKFLKHVNDRPLDKDYLRASPNKNSPPLAFEKFEKERDVYQKSNGAHNGFNNPNSYNDFNSQQRTNSSRNPSDYNQIRKDGLVKTMFGGNEDVYRYTPPTHRQQSDKFGKYNIDDLILSPKIEKFY